MIISILHNIAQVPELVEDLRRNQCLEVCHKRIYISPPVSILDFKSSYSNCWFITYFPQRIILSNIGVYNS